MGRPMSCTWPGTFFKRPRTRPSYRGWGAGAGTAGVPLGSSGAPDGTLFSGERATIHTSEAERGKRVQRRPSAKEEPSGVRYWC